MTTYPLSEPATIYGGDVSDGAKPEVIGRGTLEACAEIVAGLSSDEQKSVSIRMDDLDLAFGPDEVGELLGFLRGESDGLSNTEIAEIKRASG